MKIILFTFLMISNVVMADSIISNLTASDFELLAPPPSIDQLFLKERMKKLDESLNKGEILFHKVGNGFGAPSKKKIHLEEFMSCEIENSEYKLILLVDSNKSQHAVVTKDKSEDNHAEFLFIENRNEHIDMQRFKFYLGISPLKGQMFHLQIIKGKSGILKLVVGDKLTLSTVRCEKH